MKRAALLGELIRTGFVAVAFLLISRELPLQDVGIVSAISAALAIIGPIATLGLPFKVLRDSSRGASQVNYRSALLTVCTVTGPVFVCICMAVVYPYSQDTEIIAIAAMVLAECWLLIAFTLLMSHSIGARRPAALSLSSALVSVPRLAGALALLFHPEPSVEYYAYVLILFALPAVFCSWLLLPKQGRVRFLPMRELFADRKAGGYSTSSSLLSRCSDDMDKLFLGFMRGADEVALYSIPYRLTFYAMIPGRALLSSKMSGWYRRNGQEARGEALSVIVGTSLSGCVLSGIVYVTWPYLCSEVIGIQYASVQPLILLFGLAVVLRGVHYTLGELMFAKMMMGRRNCVQLIAVLSGILAMLVLIPSDGIVGAGISTLLIESMTLLGYLGVLYAKR
ncbi:lipopolysaccharide biosynthesis protein [uncultured Arthrobacter sp.]|uniref:lipopolysaccharide biosynthesis protein n=1 Tax=uncultured Arthrobacter sp. TaxID=114050 RepID=UPI0026165F00|nr:lipopolysaccharide biosynthesis protein [uncultured Arthrobacter sp.]